MRNSLYSKFYFGIIAFFIFDSCTISSVKDDKKSDIKTNESPIEISNEIPDIKGLNSIGDSVFIRHINAKYILVEFWASWCPPCRQANPNFVKIYDKFQQNGFEIFSISLDNDPIKWQKAIQADNLHWAYHISDLKGWDSYWAVKYGIEEIPNNILFDKNGKILAKELSPSDLDNVLTELFKK